MLVQDGLDHSSDMEVSCSRNNQITPQHPLLTRLHLLPFMQETLFPMTMEQGEARLWSNGDWIGVRITTPTPPTNGGSGSGRIWVEDRLAAGAGGEIDEEGPCCASWDW